MDYDLVIRGGRVLTAHDDVLADVAVSGGQIAAIGLGLRGEREIDAEGKYVLPGAIDGHVHMRTERADFAYDDDWETGTAAAAFGGVTTIVDQAQVEAGLTLAEGLDRRLADAEGRSLVDYSLHVNLREDNEERIAEIPAIAARGFPSFKFYMVYESYLVSDRTIFAAMQRIAEFDGLALIHAESRETIEVLLAQNAAAGRTDRRSNAAARLSVMEGEATHRALAMATATGARTMIFHMTTGEGVRELRLARDRGQEAYGEVCPQYLLIHDEDIDDPVRGTAFDVSPPPRPEHHDALWQGLADGTIDVVSTDHGPRRMARDEAGNLYTPPGTSGVEVRLALMHEFGVRAGRISAARWVDACCTRPAEVFGLERKGRLLPGYDADIVVFDPDREVALSPEVLHSNLDYTTYAGRTVRGFPVVTISRGEVLVEDGELAASPGRGRLVERSPRVAVGATA